MPLPPLLRATHLGPSVAVTAMAAGLVAASGGTGSRTILVAAAVLAGQFSVGWANDYLDRGRDRAAGRGDKPIVAGEVSDGAVWIAARTALGLCAVLSLALGVIAGLVHLAAVALGWSYDLGLKGTVASPLPYAAAFGLLPVFVGLVAGGRAPGWAVAGAALLGAGAHFTNTLPDAAHDARTGVRGLPQRWGPRVSAVVGALLLGAGGAVAGAGLHRVGALGPLGWVALAACAVLVTGVLVVGWLRATRLAFTLSIGAGIAVVVLLAGAGPLLA